MEEVIQAKHVGIIFRDLEQRKVAGHTRLAKEEDTAITTVEQADTYRGPEFTQGETCHQLSLSLCDTMASVNVQEVEDGECVSYVYPLDTIARIKVVHK
ncbi:hypothetical protein KAW1A4500_00023 [Escherichia phage vB_EcoP_KAW1A4500]|uniref:Uncharacterized protein n=1 Tax=Escherichia phage vB_EcoP_KAW1A4500 TaxID=2508205 RepID=A0A482MTB9_9CAUD|nr:hypothetical protein KAW1A4500_00023 [Escherichia phage vB_EcoP_KAW1A4500]